MVETERFIDLVENLCRRRDLYVCGGSFYEVCAYISGYASSSDCPLNGEGWTAFNEFVCAAFRFPSKYVWPYVIHKSCPDDDDATERLRALLVEFTQKTLTKSHNDIVREMRLRMSKQEEGEPEKTWRMFSSAILRGKKDEIEPLIMEHPDAEVLWSSAYPEDVAELLIDIEESYTISKVSGAEEAGNVTIITPDFGPVQLKLVSGSWRIDATKVIECWKKNQ